MSVAAGTEPWVGQSVLRVEDDALLRGEGRFLDDLAPVAARFHAAVVRSQLAARPDRRSTRRAALAQPGVVGVLTGADVRRCHGRSPPGSTLPCRSTRPRSTPCATSASRSPSSSPATATSRRTPPSSSTVDYDPLDAGARPGRRGRDRGASTTARSRTATSTRRWPRPTLVLRQTFHFPRFTCTPGRVLRRRRRLGARRTAALTAWANFQGPFTLHGVAAAALGLTGDRLRLLTPPDSGGSFGIKSSVFAYVVLIGLASRQLGVPVRWIEDRLEHLAGSAAATGRDDRGRGGLHRRRASWSRCATTRSRTSARTSARRSRRRSTGCTGRSPAPTACGTSPCATASCSRTRSPPVSTAASAGRSSTSGSSGRWRSRRGGSASTRPSWPGATWCRRTRCRTAPRRARSTTPATTRPASTRRSSSQTGTSVCARGPSGSRRGPPRRHRARLRRRAVDLEHGLHHARPDRGRARADAAEVRERRGCARRDQPARRHHRAARHDTAGAGPSHGRAHRSSPTSSA